MIHSKLGASSAKRWMNCPGSVALIDLCPPQASTAFSVEGTTAHDLAEKCLNDMTLAPSDFIGKKINDFEITKEMAGHVDGYIAYIQKLVRDTEGELLIEHKFHLNHLHPDLYGTCDAVIMEEFGTLHVVDLKYGAGVYVDAERNEQIMYYALGALRLGDFSNVRLHVYQPRIETDGEPYRTWDIHPKDLFEFGKLLKEKAMLAKKKNAPLLPGDYCRFCAAAGLCPALQSTAMEAAKSDFKDDALPSVEALSLERIAKIVELKPTIEKWLKSVKDLALLKMYAGEKIEGLKLVRSNSRREWRDEAKAAEYLSDTLGEAAFRKKLLSVPQAEKVVGKKYIEGLFDTVEGSITVTHEGDRRKEVIIDNAQLAKSEFSDLTLENEPEEF